MEYDPDDELLDAYRIELTTLRQRAEAAERRVAELEGAVRVLVAECGQWRGAKVLNPISLIDAPIRRAVCNTNANPIAKAAIDEAGGQHD